MTSALARLDALDLRLYRRAARWQTPALDRILPRLTSSADHGLLWAGIGAALALSGGGRRVYEQRVVGRLPIRSRQGGLRTARDGEVGDGPAHLLLRAAERPLVVYRPASG